MEQVRAITGVVDVHDGDRITSFLPAAHIADRVTTQYFGALLGVQVTYVADARTIGAALADTRPTIWFAVPRVWEKLKAALEAKVPGLDPATAPEPLRAQLRAAIGLDQVPLGVVRRRGHRPGDAGLLHAASASRWSSCGACRR